MSASHEPSEHGPEPSPHDQALEARLAALRPREDRLDRDRLMYLAGQAAEQAGDGAATRRVRPSWAISASAGAAVGALAASLLLALLPWVDRPGHRETDPTRTAGIASADPDADIAPSIQLRRELAASEASLDARLVAALGQPTSREVGNAPNIELDTDDDVPSPARPMTSRSIDDAMRRLGVAGRTS